MDRKQLRIAPNFQPNKCVKRCIKAARKGAMTAAVVDDDDLISQLPDHILVDILSLLSINEAARTSVLSSRWTDLWKYTHSLNLTAPFKIFTLVHRDKQDFIKWVNSVLRSHKSLTLKEFIIRFPLERKHRHEITQWLEFAFSKRVERLEMDLEAHFLHYRHYIFPENIKRHFSDNFSIGFNSLKLLSFKAVKVTDGDIDFFLRNCPLLEQLIVHNSIAILNPRVLGSSSLMLKHFEIIDCPDLTSIKISAPNLTSLGVQFLQERLSVENVPMLVEMFVKCACDYTDFRGLSALISCCVSQLETLRLRMAYLSKTKKPYGFPQLPKLKKLEIEYLASGGENLIIPTVLIRASPCLEEFVLEFSWYKLRKRDRQVKDAIILPAKGAASFPHHHLKVFKFRGYYGRANEVELIRYILDNCVVLEKLIIDPSRSKSPGPDELSVDTANARKNANQQLAGQVPSHVKLVIL